MLFDACKVISFGKKGEEKALKTILTYPYIRDRIKIQAKNSAKRNKELDQSDLEKDIETNLYINIKTEFKLSLKQSEIINWLCSRITWRTSDYIRKELNLEYIPANTQYNTNGVLIDKGFYSKLNQISIESISDLSSIEEVGEKPLEFYIRKSKIDTNVKIVLIFRYILGYKLREIGDIYGVSIHKARIMCVECLDVFKDYLKFQGISDLDSFIDRLRDI